MTSDDDSVLVYSDYVCPFCYLGRRSLDTYRDDRANDLEIEWHPFDLRRHKRTPDGEIDDSIDDGKDEAYFDQVRRNVARLKQEYDAEEMLDFDDLPDGIDSLHAQVASYYVKREYPDRWLDFDEAIFEALWIEGQDIGAVDQLADLAAGVGIDGAEVRAAITDPKLRQQVSEQFAAASQQGVTGVPTFVYDGRVARGAVPPDHLRQLIENP